MRNRRQSERILSFLAGLGLGAILGRRLGPSGGSPALESFPSRPVAAGLTASSVRRIHSLLGEIRGLVAARKGGRPPGAAGGAEAGSGFQEALEGAAAAATEAAEARPGAGAGAGAPGDSQEYPSEPAGPAGFADTVPPSLPRESWRIPDRIGYALRSQVDPRAKALGGAALVACAAAAASSWGSRRRGRMAAAWPAIPGLVAAALLWRRGPGRPGGRNLEDRIHRLQGRAAAAGRRRATP